VHFIPSGRCAGGQGNAPASKSQAVGAGPRWAGSGARSPARERRASAQSLDHSGRAAPGGRPLNSLTSKRLALSARPGSGLDPGPPP